MNRRQDAAKDSRNVRTLEDPPLARFLFGDVRLAWLWLILRLYAGWQWLEAGWGKWHDATWTGDKAGTALSGFVQGALTKSGGARPDVQIWYAWFLQHVVQAYPLAWSYLVPIGETLVGVALILGLFTGIAAFFGSFMNMNYLLAGTVSINPLLFVIATWLVLAWKTAGWWGLDRWALPALGTPWSPGRIFKHGASAGQGDSKIDHIEGEAFN
jgi:thiosulfate dehydrogenase [quinone] large subunit